MKDEDSSLLIERIHDQLMSNVNMNIQLQRWFYAAQPTHIRNDAAK